MISIAAELAFLGNAFLRPDAGFLVELAKEVPLPDFEQLLLDGGGSLEIAYNRLFLNPGGSSCPLWQSAHGDELRLMGEAHLSALEWFRRYGVEPAATNDPADHIGLLLLFYARLLDSQTEAPALERFRAEHLAWIPEFCDSVERESKHPFYTAVSRRTRALVVGA